MSSSDFPAVLVFPSETNRSESEVAEEDRNVLSSDVLGTHVPRSTAARGRKNAKNPSSEVDRGGI